MCITGSHADDTHMASVVGDDHPHTHFGHTDTHTNTQQSTVTTATTETKRMTSAATTTIIIVIIVVVATRHLGSKQTVLFVVFRNGLYSVTRNRIVSWQPLSNSSKDSHI